MKKETLLGTAFLCTQCAAEGLTTRFICGKRGIDALRERVVEHHSSTGHIMFRPLNPKPGTHYVKAGTTDRVGPVYKEGDDEEKWVADIISIARRNLLNIEPSWCLEQIND